MDAQKGLPGCLLHSTPWLLSRGNTDSLLLESQESLVSFLLNSSWFKLSFYSNSCYLPAVRKSYSSHVNVAFVYGMKSMSYTVFASFFTLAKWEVVFNCFLELSERTNQSLWRAWKKWTISEHPPHWVAQCFSWTPMSTLTTTFLKLFNLGQWEKGLGTSH